jgi:hypothetical protein
MPRKKVIDGTVQQEFSIGIGTDEIKVISVAGVVHLQNNGGSPFIPSGGGLSFDEEPFTVDITIQGSNQVTLLNTPSTKSEHVFLNGQKMIRGVDYTIAGPVVTFDPAWSLVIGDMIEAHYSY